MTALEALEVVKVILAPEALSYVQETVFRYSWEGHLYPQIAKEAGYHPEYIRDVGAQLWRSLSDALGQKVTKKNVRVILAALRQEELRRYEQDLVTVLGNSADMSAIAFPSVALPLQSPFYIRRSEAEALAMTEVDKPGGLLRLKAPGHMGKTSLLLRVLDHGRKANMKTVLLNFQEVDGEILTDLGRFLRWFCLNVTQQLNLEPCLNDYWDDGIGHKVSCKIYFREYLLKQLAQPLILALDEVDQIFEYPSLVQEFFPMLRVWHEEAMEVSIWQNLRLVLSYNTEVYVPLKISQSPFNIGLAVGLNELSLDEIQHLAMTYNLGWSDAEAANKIQNLYALVGGHPYLVQLALYGMSQLGWDWSTLLMQAPTQSGIYTAHLRRLWQVLQRRSELLLGLKAVVSASEGVQLDAVTAYQLESMGIIQLVGNLAQIKNELYRQYFQSLLPLMTTEIY
jgi:AAA-like domain